MATLSHQSTTIAQGDAALFAGAALSSSPDMDDDDSPDTEDPVDRGQAKAQALDAYRQPRPVRPPLSGVHGGNLDPLPYVRLTPGAHLVP